MNGVDFFFGFVCGIIVSSAVFFFLKKRSLPLPGMKIASSFSAGGSSSSSSTAGYTQSNVSSTTSHVKLIQLVKADLSPQAFEKKWKDLGISATFEAVLKNPISSVGVLEEELLRHNISCVAASQFKGYFFAHAEKCFCLAEIIVGPGKIITVDFKSEKATLTPSFKRAFQNALGSYIDLDQQIGV